MAEEALLTTPQLRPRRRRRMRRGPLVVLGYGLNVAATGISTIIAIPLMVSIGGVSSWAAAAVGQSIGIIVTIVVGYGWALSGPAIVARAFPGDYSTVLTESRRTRLFLLLPTLAIAGLFCYFLVPNGANRFALLGIVSTGLLGLRLNWFLIGKSKPFVMLIAEAIPRLLGIALGLYLMFVFRDMSFALLGQIAGILAGVLVCSLWIRRYIRPYSDLPHRPVNRLRENLLEHRFGMAAAIVSAIYSSGPLLMLGYTSPSSVGPYAVMDRLSKQMFTAASPLVDALRGWVPHRDGVVRRSRARAALLGSLLASAAAGGVLALWGSSLVNMLSAGQVHPDGWAALLFGLTFALSIFSMVLGQVVLVSLDMTRQLFHNGLIGSVIGLLLVVPMSLILGMHGVFAALCCGHIVVISCNTIAFKRSSRESIR